MWHTAAWAGCTWHCSLCSCCCVCAGWLLLASCPCLISACGCGPLPAWLGYEAPRGAAGTRLAVCLAKVQFPLPTPIWMARGYHRLSLHPRARLSRTSWGCSYAGCVIPPLQLSQFHSCRLQKPAMLTQSSRACTVPEHRHPVSKTVSAVP